MMKRLAILAFFAMPVLAWGGDSDPSDWRIWSSVRPGAGNGQVVLAIAGEEVARARLGATLAAKYQDHDVVVRCRPYRAAIIACDVVADAKVLKTVYFNSHPRR